MTAEFFDHRARRYDALRPQNTAWWRRFEALMDDGDLRGRRVLDIGCGTGVLAAELVARAGARVWGVDASAEMVAVTRDRAVRGLGVKQARAEALPFTDGWFERAVMSLVVHLVDRPAAFAEARRVLDHTGRLAIATFDESHFSDWWAARFFPSAQAIDLARFPTSAALEAELRGAGFADVTARLLVDEEELPRDSALARLHAGHISTFALLDPDEVRDGIARAERELPEVVASRLVQLVVVAASGADDHPVG